MSTHLFEIKPRFEGQVMTGANCLVLMDGKPVKGLKSIKLEIVTQEVAKLTMEVFGQFMVKGEIGTPLIEKVPLTVDADPIEKTPTPSDGAIRNEGGG